MLKFNKKVGVDMKVVLQVVKKANVKVKNKIVGKINNGYLLLVGIEQKDNLLI